MLLQSHRKFDIRVARSAAKAAGSRKSPLAGILAGAAFLAAAAADTSAQDARRYLTQPGMELGAQVAHYRYEEPRLITLVGNRLGGSAAYTHRLPDLAWIRGELRLSQGRLTYEGTGTQSGVPDVIFESRALLGRDFLISDAAAAVSPYAGFGYRYLFDDLRGYSYANGQAYAGYRRFSNYLYAPMGMALRLQTAGAWVVATTLEYDWFLVGNQISLLSDAGAGSTDVSNRQKRGSGRRFSLMLESGRWSFGPWTQYWNIGDSESASIAPGVLGREPKNWTRESGFELRYRL